MNVGDKLVLKARKALVEDDYLSAELASILPYPHPKNTVFTPYTLILILYTYAVC